VHTREFQKTNVVGRVTFWYSTRGSCVRAANGEYSERELRVRVTRTLLTVRGVSGVLGFGDGSETTVTGITDARVTLLGRGAAAGAFFFAAGASSGSLDSSAFVCAMGSGFSSCAEPAAGAPRSTVSGVDAAFWTVSGVAGAFFTVSGVDGASTAGGVCVAHVCRLAVSTRLRAQRKGGDACTSNGKNPTHKTKLTTKIDSELFGKQKLQQPSESFA
jgi:hypothetical protein